MKLRFLLLPVFVAFAGAAACGGATTSSSSSPEGGATKDADVGVCGPLLDSGLRCEACFARECCGQLSACAGDADGVQYTDCITSCLESPDAAALSNCQSSCASAHPNGAAACQPYYDCAAQRCITPGC